MAIDGLETNYKTWLGRERRPGPARGQANGPLDDLCYRIERRWGGGVAARRRSFRQFPLAVRARDRSRLNADIEEGVISTTLVHLANISYRLCRTIEFDPKTLTCPDPEAQTMFTKPYREPFVLPSLAEGGNPRRFYFCDAVIAWSRSQRISFTSSIPTERRTRSFETPASSCCSADSC